MSKVEPIRKKSDILKIEKALESSNYRDLVIFTLGINCGLRISDILNLNVSDVKNTSAIRLYEQKTGKYKEIPINKKLKPMLKKYTRDLLTQDPLFKSKFNKRLDRTTVYKMLKEICRQESIDTKIGTHTLRKTFGYHHYKKFKDIAMLQKIFNHVSQSVTLRYIGIEQDEINQSYLNLIL